MRLTIESRRESVKWNVPRKRMRKLPHGMAGDHCMSGQRREDGGKRLQLLSFGNTERNHPFAVELPKRLPPERFEWRVRTVAPERSLYDGIQCVTMLPRLSDEEVREEYRQADLLCMPMLDSAANDVLLESMACGTPVMTNRVGGVPEYVKEDCNIVMPADASASDWADRLLELERDRDCLDAMRGPTRQWAKNFDWEIIAEDYRAMYRELE